MKRAKPRKQEPRPIEDPMLAAAVAAVEAAPDDDEALYWRGAARARLGEREAALTDLAAAIAIDERWRDEARDEEDFNSYRDDPEFVRVTGKPRRRRRG